MLRFINKNKYIKNNLCITFVFYQVVFKALPPAGFWVLMSVSKQERLLPCVLVIVV